MTENDARRLAESLMMQHGLADWAFGFNHARRQLGVCRRRVQRIELSRHYVRLNPEYLIKDTILHEIAHALTPNDPGHGPEWRRMAARIGARPERCKDAAAVRVPPRPFVGTCENCGYKIERYRRAPRGAYHSPCQALAPVKKGIRWKRRKA